MTASLESIEGFAALCARLEDHFSPRAAVLSSAGLDEASWARVEARWLAQLAAGNDPDLAGRFAVTYGENRERRATADPAEIAGTRALAWQAEARAVGLATTGEAPPLQQAPSWTEETLPGENRPATAPEVDHTLPALPISQGAVLPFQQAPSAPLPVKRLHRFDPQTGLPLPAPVWVDLPQTPSLKP